MADHYPFWDADAKVVCQWILRLGVTESYKVVQTMSMNMATLQIQMP